MQENAILPVMAWLSSVTAKCAKRNTYLLQFLIFLVPFYWPSVYAKIFTGPLPSLLKAIQIQSSTPHIVIYCEDKTNIATRIYYSQTRCGKIEGGRWRMETMRFEEVDFFESCRIDTGDRDSCPCWETDLVVLTAHHCSSLRYSR